LRFWHATRAGTVSTDGHKLSREHPRHETIGVERNRLGQRRRFAQEDLKPLDFLILTSSHDRTRTACRLFSATAWLRT